MFGEVPRAQLDPTETNCRASHHTVKGVEDENDDSGGSGGAGGDDDDDDDGDGV